ncbi:hypothetical protein TgHK011_004572 [Trichoderma gracile]|nr:hypothetical protein TgHK011_004572 [Trichoderma gracile]
MHRQDSYLLSSRHHYHYGHHHYDHSITTQKKCGEPNRTEPNEAIDRPAECRIEESLSLNRQGCGEHCTQSHIHANVD